jgi:hypothetical protein
MSRIILSIGYVDLLLPDDKGLSTILKALGRAIQVHDRRYKDVPEIEFVEEARIEVKTVANGVRLVGLPTRKSTKHLALPEPNSILL